VQDICLDNVLGKNKPSAIPIKIPVEDLTGTSQKIAGPKKPIGRLDPVLQHASHLPKPQLLFKRKPDYSDTPWRPTLSHKYNAKVPLGYMYHDPGMDDTILWVLSIKPDNSLSFDFFIQVLIIRTNTRSHTCRILPACLPVAHRFLLHLWKSRMLPGLLLHKTFNLCYLSLGMRQNSRLILNTTATVHMQGSSV